MLSIVSIHIFFLLEPYFLLIRNALLFVGACKNCHLTDDRLVYLVSGSFGECEVPLQCQRSLVHSDLDW